ncbi:MAG: cysteine desulfurase family protein [Clostridia bacterium]|nr:cysteine desulfurase family protein [Clostridia bacterium]
MIYLDNSATTPVFDGVGEVARYYMTEQYFNPSGAYAPAAEVEKAVNRARKRVLDALGLHGTQNGSIVFTSGATESNNAAFSGALAAMRGTGRIIVGAAEHPSVYDTAAKYSALGYDIKTAPVTPTGCIDIEAFGELLSPDLQLVSIMLVNNEIGAINDIEKLYTLTKRAVPNAVFHVDGVQGFLKVPFNARYCDMFSISGHKFHAPKGIGALYVAKNVRFLGGQTGGGQENGLRSGTLNTPGIMAMEKAIEINAANESSSVDTMRACKLRLAEHLLRIDDVLVNGPAPVAGAPHILNVSFLGVRGEVMLHALEEKGIIVSTGSACSAHKSGPNRVLSAMGLNSKRQDSAVRFSFSPLNRPEEMDEVASAVRNIVTILRRYKRR